MIYLAYLLIAVISILFIRTPFKAIILVFLTKPIIDMFWESKYQGFISPLFIAAVLIPFLAIVFRKKTGKRLVKNKHDKIILLYIGIFGFLTVLKMINNPKYIPNSIDNYARILSVTAFYFIGKFYFQDEKKKKQLSLAIVFSTIVPFFLTFFQVYGGNLINKPMYMEKGARSALYIEGRHDLLRISGVYEGVYELAFLGLFVALIMICLRLSRTYFPLWGYPMMGLGLYFLYFTYSRTAWSLFLFTLLVFGFIRKKYIFIGSILLSVILLYTFIPKVQYRFEDELGFISGEKELGTVGYGRGNVWMRTWNDFSNQELFPQMVGTHGLGNPENQFLGLLIWNGYIGLFTFLVLIIYLTWQLWKLRRRIRNDNSFSANISVIFIAVIIGGYWLAGLGNFFLAMISTQWVLWTWTGILLNDPGYRGQVAASKHVGPDRLSNSLRQPNQYKPFIKNA
jgi:hypothetical protein